MIIFPFTSYTPYISYPTINGLLALVLLFAFHMSSTLCYAQSFYSVYWK